MVVGFCGGLLFLFVPESFWDRSPVPKSRKNFKNTSRLSLFSKRRGSKTVPPNGLASQTDGNIDSSNLEKTVTSRSASSPLPKKPAEVHRSVPPRSLHVGFAPDEHHDGTAHGQNYDGTHSPGEVANYLSSTGMSPLQSGPPGKL